MSLRKKALLKQLMEIFIYVHMHVHVSIQSKKIKPFNYNITENVHAERMRISYFMHAYGSRNIILSTAGKSLIQAYITVNDTFRITLVCITTRTTTSISARKYETYG